MFAPSQTFKKCHILFVYRLVSFLYSTHSLKKNEISFSLQSTTIIIFPHKPDAVLCFYCTMQRKKGTLVSERNIEDAYTTKGFSSWKKALQCFEEHQQTHCNKFAASYHVVVQKCKEMTNDNLVNVREKK